MVSQSLNSASPVWRGWARELLVKILQIGGQLLEPWVSNLTEVVRTSASRSRAGRSRDTGDSPGWWQNSQALDLEV